MITNEHKDVLEEFLQRTEEELHSDATLQEIERVKKELKQLDQKMQRLLDMHLEQQIDFGTYEDKKLEIIKEQQLKTTELKRLQGEADVEKDLRKRLDAMRKLLSEAPILKEFDRNVFESIVEKVIVGGYDDEGNADPSMITFVYKTGFEDKKKGDDYKPPRRNSKSKKLSSQPTDGSSKLSQQATDVADEKGTLEKGTSSSAGSEQQALSKAITGVPRSGSCERIRMAFCQRHISQLCLRVLRVDQEGFDRRIRILYHDKRRTEPCPL
ncbi:MAG: hypothetical protein Q4F43_09620 [Eubacteriales bacterium]|nr:hypothetical protein [Eubacteriales bacterium]